MGQTVVAKTIKEHKKDKNAIFMQEKVAKMDQNDLQHSKFQELVSKRYVSLND